MVFTGGLFNAFNGSNLALASVSVGGYLRMICFRGKNNNKNKQKKDVTHNVHSPGTGQVHVYFFFLGESIFNVKCQKNFPTGKLDYFTCVPTICV